MLRTILKNKIFRVCLILIIIIFPFSSKYRFVKTVGPSMEPTIMDGEWVVFEKRSSLGENWSPRRLDNVIIKDKEENLSKRIIGLPGDTIEIKEGFIYLNGKKLQDPFGRGEISLYLVNEDHEYLRYWNGDDKGKLVVELMDSMPEKVPDRHVWVIGDNRRDSWFGLLPVKNIVGKILY